MKYSEAKIGRIFVLRLEGGEKMPDSVEKFALKHKINSGTCFLIGGINSGKIVVGPENGKDMPPVPMLHEIAGVHEIAGIGMIFPDEEGKPRLHMHAAFGRHGNTVSGCIRPGIEVWKVGEVIIFELTGSGARRVKDKATGFDLLTM